MTNEKDYMREYMRKWRKKNPEKVKAANDKAYAKNGPAYYRDRYREKYNALKKKAVAYKGGKCSRCGGIFHQAAMDFHHTEPVNKTKSICRLISDMRPWKAIKIELDKCILVCANCHRIIEAE